MYQVFFFFDMTVCRPKDPHPNDPWDVQLIRCRCSCSFGLRAGPRPIVCRLFTETAHGERSPFGRTRYETKALIAGQPKPLPLHISMSTFLRPRLDCINSAHHLVIREELGVCTTNQHEGLRGE